MKFNKFFIILVVLLAGFLLVNTSVATELDNSVVADSASSNQDINVNDVDNNVKAGDAGSDINKLGDGEKNFAYLNDLIQNTHEGEELILSDNYIFNSSTDMVFKNGVVVNKSITINGNNSFINGSNLARIFNVTADNVVIKDLSFIEGATTEAGTVYWAGANGSLVNCTFNDNVFSSNDPVLGIITWDGVNGSIVDCIFSNNTFNITDSTSENGNLSIINWKGANGSIINSTFNDSYFMVDSDTKQGYIIVCSGDYAIISGCIFNNMSIYGMNLILWNFNEYNSINDCSFKDITTQNDSFSCILNGMSNPYSVIVNNTFNNISLGFLIAFISNEVLIDNCNFSNYDVDFAVIALTGGGRWNNIANCTFNNGRGLGIFLEGALHTSIIDCIFNNNSRSVNVENDGGNGIFVNEGSNNVSIVHCSFNDNKIYREGDLGGYGGAIYLDSSKNINIKDSTFSSNVAPVGGAIAFVDTNSSIVNCSFIDNVVSEYGGSIYIGADSNVDIIDSSATPSSGDIKAPIYNDGNIVSDIEIITIGGKFKNVGYGETVKLTGTVTTSRIPVAGQKLTFVVNDKKISVEDDGTGLFAANYKVNFLGNKDVDASYTGADGGIQLVDMGKLVSSKANVTMTVDDVKGKARDKIKFTAKVNDIYGNPVKDGVVIFGFDGKEYKENIVNGVATVKVVLLKAGTYSATAYYDGDKFHESAYAVFTVESSKVNVIVTVDDVKGKVGDKVKFTAKVNDIYGIPVKDGVVIFGFDGKEYKANIVNGVATVKVVLLKAGTYSATAYYDGDKFHESAYTIFTVEVINNPNPTNHSGIPMEHTGNPLIALLFALITLPILRRK